MRAVVLAALLALSTCGHPAFAGPCYRHDRPARPNLEYLKVSGLENESLDGDDMARALAALRAEVSFDETPSSIVFVYGHERAAVWLIDGDMLCNIIYGPAQGLREIVKAARGQGV